MQLQQEAEEEDRQVERDRLIAEAIAAGGQASPAPPPSEPAGPSLAAAGLEPGLSPGARAAQEAAELLDAAFARSLAPFDCPICSDSHPRSDAFVVSSCRPLSDDGNEVEADAHTICRDCARTYIIGEVGRQQLPVRCPLCPPRPSGWAWDGVDWSGLILPNECELVLSEEEIRIMCALLRPSSFSLLLPPFSFPL